MLMDVSVRVYSKTNKSHEVVVVQIDAGSSMEAGAKARALVASEYENKGVAVHSIMPAEQKPVVIEVDSEDYTPDPTPSLEGEVKPKRKRRTKAQIEADKAK